MSSQKKRNTSKEDKNAVIGGMLYLVATPIGNLSDISERALKVLSEVDFIAAEDTRNTGNMLQHFEINKPMISYFEHNKRERGEIIVERLQGGESCALVTDAGTPAISDPGEDLVRLCAEKGVAVTSIPGCCAAINALALSGLCTSRFVFEGFISTSKSERNKRLSELSTEQRTMIFYEAPHKLRGTLADFYKHFGDRHIALCRELTKLNEEICRTTISDAIRIYEERDPRGEYVLVIEGNSTMDEGGDFPDDPVEHVNSLIDGGMSKMEAIKAAAKARGVTKNDIYSLVMRKENDE